MKSFIYHSWEANDWIMDKTKDKHIIRVNMGSSEIIISNKTKGLFYFDKEGKFFFIKNGVLNKKEFDSIDELMAYVDKNER